MTARPRLDVRQILAAKMTEAELDQAVRDLAKWLRLHCFSIRNSLAGRVSEPGFPDMVIVGAGGVLWRELKRQNGRLRPGQIEYGSALQAAGQDWKVWRPSDLIGGVIEAELRQLATPTSPRKAGNYQKGTR